MSKIVAYIEDNKLHIKKEGTRNYSDYNEIVALDEMVIGKQYKSLQKSTNPAQNFKVILEEEVYCNGITGTLIVYIKNANINYYFAEKNVYTKLVQLKKKVLFIGMNKRKINILFIGFIINPFLLDVSGTEFSIGGVKNYKLKLKEYKDSPGIYSKLFHNIYLVRFDIRKEIAFESSINSDIEIICKVNGRALAYPVKYIKKINKNKRKYYAPIKAVFTGNYAVHVRSNLNGKLIFVKRKIEPIEKNILYRIYSSELCLILFSFLSKMYCKCVRRKINLYFEKFAMKAEEGALDLCELAQDSIMSKNYFVINDMAEDYEGIKNLKFVVRQYSLKYFWLYFCATNIIGTEAPSQLGVMRGNSRRFRLELVNKKNIFLQHGIIYLKNLGKLSVFSKGREGSCDYIIASSEKESEVICEMLNMNESEVIVAGLPIFSKVGYKHINNDSKDVVTIMLTWKPYEEHLEEFSESTYYKNTVEIYNIIKEYIDPDNINIVAHPKVEDLLSTTDLSSNMWKGKISEVLTETKLLITDYSSICYNAFYQGAGVIFVHDDIDLYEEYNGCMIPEENEYIGDRVFELEKLKPVLEKAIKNKKIDLTKLRTSRHEEIYQSINEFSDGKNIERIYNKLVELDIV